MSLEKGSISPKFAAYDAARAFVIETYGAVGYAISEVTEVNSTTWKCTVMGKTQDQGDLPGIAELTVDVSDPSVPQVLTHTPPSEVIANRRTQLDDIRGSVHVVFLRQMEACGQR